MSDPKQDGSTQSSQNSSPSRDDQTTNKENVRKKITPKAACWNHFTKFVTEEGEKRARCNTCDVTYTMESTSGSTKNLNNHLKACLKRPRGNTSNPKQSELTFVKVSQETTDLSTWVVDKDAVRKALVRMSLFDDRHLDFIAEDILYGFNTAHRVDDKWRLQKRIINFCPISVHRGESIGQAIKKCLRDWGIESVFTITVDNASANSVAIEYLRKKLNHRNVSVANGKFIHMICVAHILNLIVQYGIKDATVSVDRVRGAVRYIRASPSRLTEFNQRVKEEMIDSKAQLCLDVPTRWNSTYMMLKVVENYKRAFESYVRDDYNFFLDLTAGDGVPTFDDWEIVRRVIKVLEPFYHLTLKVSESLHVTSHSLFEVLTDVHCIFDGWQDCGDLDIISMTSKMREKYNKYWGEGNKVNMLVYLAVIFDPRCKMIFLNFRVNLLFPNVANDIMKMIDKELHCLFNEYSSNARRIELFEGRSSSSTNLCSSMEIDQSAMKTGLAKQQYLKKNKQVGLESKSELDRYLGEDEEVNNSSSFDLLLWWKMNSPRFPILAQMARDILAIPISTVASESAISTGERVLDSFRSSLTPLMVEALVYTQDCLRKSNDAFNLEDYVDELQTMEDGNI
ncbi:zinc finger BED domain-containing protein RICESLEEPER 1-like [Gossypium hirsutum]|uniref:Zinc finger BED domain-containing protein RICESLEEPER 1-like n=1 Tax=Gossypium hirsutum TaxID=3635 RepID=A0A1U8KRK9_GOSHI|nr:zinc finger BED domain-containing protein RICESLEEPER 1-like [Gossypium hirsutum]